MLFNSSSFLFAFLPVTIVVFFALARMSRPAALAFLTLASIYFYMQTNSRYLYVLLPSIVFNFAVGRAISRVKFDDRRSRWTLAFGIAVNLIVLFTFKYLDLFIRTIDAVGLANLPEQKIELPLGISFFTFTQIAFLVDTYQRKAQEAQFVNYALFVTYFPHLVAGPILHHSEMMPQFSAPAIYRPRWENFAVGLTVFFIGLFKKVILADSIAPHVHKVFDAAAQGSALTALEGWSGALFYALQIYFDFSGYSDMAIGLSLLFGVRLPLNFNSPYKALSIIDFWRRWHMTLSRFLRDYVYVPLGGNRSGNVRRLINIMIVMLAGGLWHGASWTFVVWGGLHGLYLVVNHAWRLAVPQPIVRHPLFTVAGWLTTFVLVTFAWVFFRAPDMSAATGMSIAMLGLGNGNLSTGYFSTPYLPSLELFLFAAAMLGIAWFAPNTQEIMSRYQPALQAADRKPAEIFQWRPNVTFAVIVSGLAIASLTMIVYVKRVGDFIYFQF